MKGNNGWWLLQGGSALYIYIYIYIYTRESAQTIYSERGGAESRHTFTSDESPKKNQFIYVGIVSGLWLDPTQM